jgi:hypothetical protein
MTTGTTTPRAAVPQVPRIVKRFGAVGLLALALLFVRPREMPGTHSSTTARAAAADVVVREPAFTVATLVSREPVAGPPVAARLGTPDPQPDLQFVTQRPL